MKRSTRLLSLLLAALMLLTALPAVSAAEDAIQSVTVTFIPPTEGTEIKSLTSSDFQDVVTVPSTDPYTVCDAYWMNEDGTEAFDPNQTPGATFEAGKTYYIFIEIEAKPGYEFTVIPEYTLVEGEEEKINLTSSGNFTIKASVKAKEKAPVPEAIAIGSASVTLTVPEAGTSSETKPAITLPDGANYEVEACLWNQEDGSHAEKDTLVPYTFKAGQTYTFWVTLKAKEGYYFESAATVALSGCTQKGDLDIYTNATFTYSCIVLIASVKIAEAETCTVTFDANGGSGEMDPVSVNKGAEYELPACGFTAPEGKVFDKWDQGAVGEKITVSADTTVKALWKDKPAETCTVTFDANGGSGNMDPVSVNKGAEYELPACGFTAPEGKVFDKWDKGAPGEKIVINADTEIKAQWKEAAGVSQKYTIETDEYTYVVDHSNTKVTESEAGQQLWVMYSTENLPEGKYIVYNSFVTEPGDLGIGQADSGLTFRMPSQNVKISAVVKDRTIGEVDLSEKDEIVITDEMRHGLTQYYLETTKADDFSYPLEMDLNGDSAADLIIGFRDDDSVATRGPGADKVTEPVTLMRQASDLSYDDPYSGFLVTLNKAPEPEPEPEPETCTVTFNANGGTGKMASVTVEKGSEYTLPKCTFTPPYSSTFTKWNLGKAGAKITVTADTVLKAQWKIVKTNPKLTAKNASFKIKTKTKKYTVVLKDKNGKAIKGAKLTLKVNNKTYKAKTNSKGKATFKITKLTKKGKFKAVIKYPGNKYFKAISKTVKITVK